MMYFYASVMGNPKIFFSISLCIFIHHLVNRARKKKNFVKKLVNKNRNRKRMSYQVEGEIGDLGSHGNSFLGQQDCPPHNLLRLQSLYMQNEMILLPISLNHYNEIFKKRMKIFLVNFKALCRCYIIHLSNWESNSKLQMLMYILSSLRL